MNSTTLLTSPSTSTTLRQHSDAATTSTSLTPAPAPSQQKCGLRLTPAAVERVRFLLAKREEARRKKEEEEGVEDKENENSTTSPVLRLTVEAGGCSGFSYVFALDDKGPRRGDRTFREEEEGAGTSLSSPPLLAVDPVSFDLVKGATVDFEQELIKTGFEVVDNPNAEAGCGCGSSFAVKSF